MNTSTSLKDGFDGLNYQVVWESFRVGLETPFQLKL